MKSAKKQYYWDISNILKKHCLWNIVIGERSNGKTTGVLRHGVRRFLEKGYQMAVIRRYREDFRGKRGAAMFDSLECNGYGENEIKEMSKGKYDCVYYFSGRWYLAKYDAENDKKVAAPTPFAIAFSLTEFEHDKSTSWPFIRTCLYDEALSRNPIPNEFTYLTNVLSTIIRDRGPEDDIEIWLLGNTVNKYSPIFSEMGLRDIVKMKPGEISIFKYEGTDLTVAVEYCQSAAKFGGKKSDVFFAFNTAATRMITMGAWEIPSYPHNDVEYKPKDIAFTYFIVWEYNTLQCEIVVKDGNAFTFIHRKTTDLKDTEHDIIFDKEYHQQLNYMRNIAKPATKLGKKIWWFFQSDNVYYQDNEIGELVNNYLKWCASTTITTA